MKDIKTTRSICPECLKALDATIYEDDGKVFIKKECPEHGAFQELPNANSKFKIELSHMPNGVPLTVEMNKTVYLRFISGDKTDLNNLFVPPGTQTFRVIAQNGGQQVDSNIVSSEFKAKKKKNLKIEMQNQGSVPAGAAAPLSPGAKIYVSLSTPIF